MSDDEPDGTATPLPLPAGRPRSEIRFSVAGLPGVWRMIADLTTSATVIDVTRVRGEDSILAALGERLVELERDRERGSEV